MENGLWENCPEGVALDNVGTPTAAPTFAPTTAGPQGDVVSDNPLEGAAVSTIMSHTGKTLQLKEGMDFTTTCSHIHCSLSGAGVTLVHHHNKELYGHKHICKYGMHKLDKCGCECYGEDFGLLTEIASLMDLPTDSPTTSPTASPTAPPTVSPTDAPTLV
jgi:hypothetical protein